jgi:phosphate-selective porin OprO/OprP
MIDTGKLVSEGGDYFSPELALVVGPLSVQAEYFCANVDRDLGGSLSFGGFYAYASYSITGESRVYNPSDASFGTVRPKRNFALKRGSGWGSWEVALRYSSLDLNDNEIRGGAEKNVTFGLNWQLDPNIRIMFNYVHAHVDETTLGTQPLVKGDTNIYMMRFQIAY